jgi:hypothetical protein
MQARWSNADGITQWGMSRATPEATGRRHQATTLSVLPWQLPGWQQTKQQWKKVQTLLAILMAMAVRQYNTVHIAWWRRSTALVKADGCCHQASIAANSWNQSRICQFVSEFFHCQLIEKGHGWMLRPQSTIRVWHIKMMRRIKLIVWILYGGVKQAE